MIEERAYPLQIRGDLSPDLSRWLWLVKWLLAMPHFIVLIFLSLAAFVVWVIAWWAILFTARYPRGMFNYIVGVMRWWWRVSFYAFYPLATDRYPPFSLKSNDDYPADLYVEYPERLSRVKVIFKWWLLAIPHYLVVMLFAGMQALLQNAINTIALGFGVLQFGDSGDKEVFEHGLTLMIMGASSLPFAAIAAVGLMGVLVRSSLRNAAVPRALPHRHIRACHGHAALELPRIRLLRPTLRRLPTLPPQAIIGWHGHTG